jgi:hypothetical protein
MAGKSEKTEDNWDFFWASVEEFAVLIDGATGTPIASTLTKAAKTAVDAKKKEHDGLIPNPLFVSNGQEDAGSPKTEEYLKGRKWKSIGAGVVAQVGTIASSATVVDVGGILQHANATGSTLVHLHKLAAIAKSHKQSQTISDWIAVLMRMKAAKAAIRGGSLLSSAIPVPAVGAIATAISSAVQKGLKITYTKVCLATASELHWRAFAEQKLAGAFGGGKGAAVGPASRIVHEMFVRRGATRVFGQYDVGALIREPCGWMALSDKVMLI